MILVSIRSEDPKIEEAINEAGIPTLREDQRYGDYVWGTRDNLVEAVELKQVMDLLSSLQTGRLEKQLAGCLDAYDRTILGIIGVVHPAEDGSMDLYEKFNGSFTRKRWKEKPQPLTRPFRSYAAFKIRIQQLGVDVFEASTTQSAAQHIIASYKNAQKKDHGVLRRYIREKPILWTPDPQIETLLSIAHVNRVRLTTKAAREMLVRWGTVWEVLRHGPEEWCEIEGIGAKVAQGLNEAIGRK